MSDKPFAITLGEHTSLANHTGAWRSERPVYVDGLPPCNHACPAGEQVQAWLYAAEDGSYEQAWRRLVDVNPFPAVIGRVCYHPCETACNRAELDTAVGINSVERFLGDHAIEQGWALPPAAAATGRRVLVIGGGPAGLAAAYRLRRLGHTVVLADAATELGGMMRHGIPTFRLPRGVLDAEIARLIDTGVEVRTGTRIDDLAAAREQGRFDAVLLATGAPLRHRAYIPAAQSARLLDALDLLGQTAAGERPQLGRRVVVYGGGNTAMDAARTARRLGADEALIVYRRTRAQMPADRSEVADAEAEGVQLKWLSTIAAADDGRITVERMQLDGDGKPQPTGQFEDLAADTVVLALGQDVDRALLATLPGLVVRDGAVAVGGDLMTTVPGVFAAGDVEPAQRSVTAAIGHGNAAARGIDDWLRRQPPPSTSSTGPAAPVPFESLNTWYYSDAPHAVRPRLEAARRVDDFGEVVGGLDAETARYEACRCLSCGNCFGCDNCYGVCPDNAVHKVGPPATATDAEAATDAAADAGHGYVIDYDYCKGCGLCAAECPCGAIVMVPEPT